MPSTVPAQNGKRVVYTPSHRIPSGLYFLFKNLLRVDTHMNMPLNTS